MAEVKSDEHRYDRWNHYSEGDGRVPIGPLSRSLTNEVDEFSDVLVHRHEVLYGRGLRERRR